jgi:hypothetical protein
MVHGIIIAVMVTAAWILLQNLAMLIRPVENRFRAMVVGYLMSLPLIIIAYRWMPPISLGVADGLRLESPQLGLFHAYFLHLLLFVCYVECFYHVERSVTLRMLVELRKYGEQGALLAAIQGRYSVEDMIQQRLEVLRDRGFLGQQGATWHLRPKGLMLARIVVVACWLFQAKTQYERD